MSSLLALVLAFQPDPLQDVVQFQDRLVALCEKISPAYVFVGGGSGVLISSDGWILTNHHVAGPSGGSMSVQLSGGRSFMADVIGHDPGGDVSLMKVRDARELPFLELGESDALSVGQFVVAVGNPFGLGTDSAQPTITFGVVSAFHRFQDWYMDAIHTDAHINPGNSGGPLITLNARIVGINGRGGFYHRRTRVSNGIGLAISSSQIRRYLPQLRVGGRVYHGMIDGITVTEAGDEDYEHAGSYGEGVLVVGVTDGTRAAEAGLAAGDLIVEVGSYRCFNKNRLFGITGSYPVGSRVPMRVKRRADGAWKEHGTEIVLGDPAKAPEGEPAWGPLMYGFAPGYDQEGDGLKIHSIVEGGPAGTAGLRPGDKVLEADGRPVREFADFVRSLVERKPGEAVKLKVRRAEATLEAPLTLGENPEWRRRQQQSPEVPPLPEKP
jgi:serine protease DegQ